MNVIENGILENPHVDAAMMLHVTTGVPVPDGILMVMDGGRGMASYDKFTITVHGRAGHGAMPHMAVDAISAAAHIHTALSEIHSRELTPGTFGVLTIGTFHAGTAPNVIADTAVLEGTIRTEDEAVRTLIKERMSSFCHDIAHAYRCDAEVIFPQQCPSMISSHSVAD